jgi:hypothetical protein
MRQNRINGPESLTENSTSTATASATSQGKQHEFRAAHQGRGGTCRGLGARWRSPGPLCHTAGLAPAPRSPSAPSSTTVAAAEPDATRSPPPSPYCSCAGVIHASRSRSLTCGARLHRREAAGVSRPWRRARAATRLKSCRLPFGRSRLSPTRTRSLARHTCRARDASLSPGPLRGAQPRPHREHSFGTRTVEIPCARAETGLAAGTSQWSQPGSNRRPPA